MEEAEVVDVVEAAPTDSSQGKAIVKLLSRSVLPALRKHLVHNNNREVRPQVATAIVKLFGLLPPKISRSQLPHVL